MGLFVSFLVLGFRCWLVQGDEKQRTLVKSGFSYIIYWLGIGIM